jgi:hypothetical protein
METWQTVITVVLALALAGALTAFLWTGVRRALGHYDG